MYIVTGGPGFIGSNIAAALDRAGDACLDQLRSLNAHGWSKHVFDSFVAEQIHNRGGGRLFRSDQPDDADGGQLRDFVWVGDCVSMIQRVRTAETMPSGLYNVGSGVARTFLDRRGSSSRPGVRPRCLNSSICQRR